LAEEERRRELDQRRAAAEGEAKRKEEELKSVATAKEADRQRQEASKEQQREKQAREAAAKQQAEQQARDAAAKQQADQQAREAAKAEQLRSRASPSPASRALPPAVAFQAPAMKPGPIEGMLGVPPEDGERRLSQVSGYAGSQMSAAVKSPRTMQKRIQEVEARGCVAFDPTGSKIHIAGKLKFKDRFFGIARQDEPVAEFESMELARTALQDVYDLWRVYKVPAVVVSMRKQDKPGRPNPKKDAWDEQLATNRANLIRELLTKFGIPQDMISSSMAFGPEDAHYVDLRMPSVLASRSGPQ